MNSINKNIVVTGGAGFIGSHTCKMLHKFGYNPIVIDNLVYGHEYAVKWGLFYKLDINDYGNLIQIFSKHKPIAVIHFAAYAYVGESVIDPYKYYQNNVCGTLTLLQAMKETGCRHLVFSSTCATYGKAENIPIDETHSQNPINPYGQSKLMVEKILQDASLAYPFNYASLRYFNASGSDPDLEIGEDHNPETHLIPLVLKAALGINDSISIYGDDYETIDGTCIRDYIHVNDLAVAHIKALEYIIDNKSSLQLNLGTGVGHSVKEIIAATKKVSNKDFITKIIAKREGDPPILISNPKKAFEILNWNPKYTNIETQIEHAWKWILKRNK